LKESFVSSSEIYFDNIFEEDHYSVDVFR
jgi:hypothetical protein